MFTMLACDAVVLHADCVTIFRCNRLLNEVYKGRTTWTHCKPSVVCLKAPSRMGHTMHLASREPPGGFARGVLQVISQCDQWLRSV